ncbi:hypothetical protein GCM10014715_77630 [Streptomyces spiralis]|uniref:Uncharacterized protein n=1 Tax=Streptomyces spiralis TaxID=66376 RepID=A0A919E1J2_9ACTN|nr:hypothetical protein GCM10014715_77630 [Streptomyces spiralis]
MWFSLCVVPRADGAGAQGRSLRGAVSNRPATTRKSTYAGPRPWEASAAGTASGAWRRKTAAPTADRTRGRPG